jgi:hypothetical protein
MTQRTAISIGLSASLIALAAAAAAQTPNGLTGPQTQQLQTLETQERQRSPVQKKISSNLLNAVAATRRQPPANVRLTTQAHKPEDKAQITVKGQISDELQQFIASKGGTDIAALPQFKMLSVELPLAAVEAVAARPEVKSIDFAARPIVNQVSGLQDPQGDLAHAAQAARAQYHGSGAGVKVCVISDSVRFLSAAQTNHALGDVKVLAGASGVFQTDEGEGTAMLEIVHRIAPDATLEFATAYPTDAHMVLNILKLKDDGCNIIVDDITYFNESPFQDGPIAQAVTQVANAGVLYFSSAANSGNKTHGTSGTWEGDFKPSSTTIVNDGVTYVYHEFAPGVIWNRVTNGGVAGLFWTDPLNLASNDYQLLVKDTAGQLHISNNSITGQGDPYQSYPLQDGDQVAILKEQSAQTRFLHLATNRAQLAVSTHGATQGHNASGAGNAFTVASITAATRQSAFVGGTGVKVDAWSSDGPRRMFYDPDGHPLTSGPNNLTASGGVELKKPDLTAADCVTTDNPTPGLNNFCGTSAAAPHAAAIAALVKSAYPDLTPAQIRAALTGTALDIEASGWDENSGFGIAMPGPALQAAGEVAAQPFVSFEDRNVKARNARVSVSGSVSYKDLAGGVAFFSSGDRVTVNFNSSVGNRPVELDILQCTSALWPQVGYAPVTFSLNGAVFAANYDVSQHNNNTRDYAFDRLPIPANALRQGANELTIVAQPGMRSQYWLKNLRLVGM